MSDYTNKMLYNAVNAGIQTAWQMGERVLAPPAPRSPTPSLARGYHGKSWEDSVARTGLYSGMTYSISDMGGFLGTALYQKQYANEIQTRKEYEEEQRKAQEQARANGTMPDDPLKDVEMGLFGMFESAFGSLKRLGERIGNMFSGRGWNTNNQADNLELLAAYMSGQMGDGTAMGDVPQELKEMMDRKGWDLRTPGQKVSDPELYSQFPRDNTGVVVHVAAALNQIYEGATDEKIDQQEERVESLEEQIRNLDPNSKNYATTMKSLMQSYNQAFREFFFTKTIVDVAGKQDGGEKYRLLDYAKPIVGYTCNIQAYWEYGKVTGNEDRSLVEFYRDELLAGNIGKIDFEKNSAGKPKLGEVKGYDMYYGAGGDAWAKKYGMTATEDQKGTVLDSNGERKSTFCDTDGQVKQVWDTVTEDMISRLNGSGKNYAVLWINKRGNGSPTGYHFILAEKRNNVWINRDHCYDNARRGLSVDWREIYRIKY